MCVLLKPIIFKSLLDALLQSHGASLRDHQNEKRETDLTLASSPENLWNCMKKELKDICSPNLDRLQQEIKGVWRCWTSLKLCYNLVSSMPRRLAAVIEVNGETAKY